ncbi:VF530 family DNA-binding protein [Thalassotalea mangrovi]|uniref:DUF2132 domain-containing protein n=1 Tax=Thalassotalea mangrovi TaxID=2572245 RepID=A0A4U1B5C2_9GAMM|nr:VF530 family protein [Thalassotalea mangrovi]TKB45539.1 DUF2132 domain-containing protein [Thalassotalea mangrovi]
MTNQQPNNPLHGVTLETIVVTLQQKFGWNTLGEHIKINCFRSDPSVKSSLKFLRKTPWARAQVEQLYIDTIVHGEDLLSDSVQDPDPWANFQGK